MFILYIFVCNVIYHIWKYLYIVFKIFSVTLIKHKYKCIKTHLGEHSRNIWKPILIRGRQIILKPIQIWGRFQNICYHPKLIVCFGCDIKYMCGHILHYLSEKASDRSTYLCISIEYFFGPVLEWWYCRTGSYDKDAEACDRNLNLQPEPFSTDFFRILKQNVFGPDHGRAEVMIGEWNLWTEMWIYNLISCICPTWHLAIDHKNENLLSFLKKSVWIL